MCFGNLDLTCSSNMLASAIHMNPWTSGAETLTPAKQHNILSSVTRGEKAESTSFLVWLP
jgi:hypothetical protein